MKKILVAGLAVVATSAFAQVSFTGSAYSQSFDSLANTGTANAWADNSTLAGWYASSGNLGGPITTYRASDGASNAGAVYSFGANNSSERALGSVSSGGSSAGTFDYGVVIQNNSGQGLSDFTVRYTGEQWRAGGNTVLHTLTFSYKVRADLSGFAINEAGFTNFSALDFTTPTFNGGVAAAIDGNANSQSLIQTIAQSVGVGEYVILRWTDINDTGNDHGMGIDELGFTATPVPEPATMLLLAGGLALAARRRKA